MEFVSTINLNIWNIPTKSYTIINAGARNNWKGELNLYGGSGAVLLNYFLEVLTENSTIADNNYRDNLQNPLVGKTYFEINPTVNL